MDIVKKNWLSIACLVVALIAIVALFWPIGGWYEDLQTRVNASKSSHGTVTGLLNKSRTLPIVDPERTEAPPLNQFPTERVIQAARAASDQMKTESEALRKAVVARNARKPLVDQVFPRPVSTSAVVAFQRRYTQLMDYTNWDERVRQQTLVYSKLKAGVPPTEQDLQRRREETAAAITQRLTIYDPSGRPTNQPDVQARVQEALLNLPEQIRSDVARNSLIYINHDALDIYPGVINSPQPPPSPTLWYAQLGYWLQEDVIEAIAAINRNSKNVMESPVKHLIKIDIPDNPWALSGPVQPSPDPNVPAVVPLSTPDQKVAIVSVTGRACNPLYDVVHYTVVLNVDAEAVPSVLLELSRNRLTTVLQTEMAAVDSGNALLNGFYYGEKPIVQLTLKLEKVLMRDWTVSLMPPAIKTALGVQQEPVPGM